MTSHESNKTATTAAAHARSPEEEEKYLAALQKWADEKDTMKAGDGTFGPSGGYANQASLFGTANGDPLDDDPNNDKRRRGSLFGKLFGHNKEPKGETTEGNQASTSHNASHLHTQENLQDIIDRDVQERKAKVESWQRDLNDREDN